MKLDEIRFKIKAYGYDAETNLVLHDIGDEDKENVLNFHSEKLAVAYRRSLCAIEHDFTDLKRVNVLGEIIGELRRTCKVATAAHSQTQLSTKSNENHI
ncbi:hypothetical protein Ahy_B03g065824 [Arachis hypogaea]|uniref:DYW domain-containing protein n=1 Tax=Arachis hypogaea TaxID=3818 RepID=A0A445A2F4_ARAHY|nr:hypothetical protein Ahy_B03g065824 [Arachis hypogaea]